MSGGKLVKTSKSSIISSRCLPSIPRHKLTRAGGFLFIKGDPDDCSEGL
ncbi:hypothetical protein HanXRQr2_Chr11g0484781 [Helianthus annuus]|uniref:Uncharacterized protein n=1 Tax=Helianthus annuus TaxID=4232 RepID=A0A9K3HNN8_HELAN|nr:hypothetical protein HanXRQr2_Chr11g0484781 [Helianthus annuus]KAJ0874636.1 hypothetical protein HanPSC8_Chr11g0466581 [Helianthus annuus]